MGWLDGTFRAQSRFNTRCPDQVQTQAKVRFEVDMSYSLFQYKNAEWKLGGKANEILTQSKTPEVQLSVTVTRCQKAASNSEISKTATYAKTSTIEVQGVDWLGKKELSPDNVH